MFRSMIALSKKKWAIINITSIATSGSSDSNTKFYETGLYSLYSPINEVNGQLIEAQNIDEDANNSVQNQTWTNNGCTDYINKNLPEKYIVLVSRGVCTFQRKIEIAVANKASAIIIYNNDLSVITMFSKSKVLQFSNK